MAKSNWLKRAFTPNKYVRKAWGTLKDSGFNSARALNTVMTPAIRRAEAIETPEERLQREATAAQETSAKTLSRISGFEDSYSPFQFDPNSQNLKYLNRVAGQQRAQTGEEIARSMAQSGVTSGGNYGRNMARLGVAQEQLRAANVNQEYAGQKAEYLGQKQQKFNNMVGVYGLQDAAVQQARDQYYNQLALQQQQALLEYQRTQQKNEGIWNAVSGLAGMIPVAGPLISGGIDLIGAAVRK